MREEAARGDISAVHMDGVDAWEDSEAQQGSESKVELPPHSLPLDLLRSWSLLVAPVRTPVSSDNSLCCRFASPQHEITPFPLDVLFLQDCSRTLHIAISLGYFSHQITVNPYG